MAPPPAPTPMMTTGRGAAVQPCERSQLEMGTFEVDATVVPVTVAVAGARVKNKREDLGQLHPV